MPTRDERSALRRLCGDHPVAVCPQCGEVLTIVRVTTDLVDANRDLCPVCRGDLTAALRKHLAECTWIRVQAHEARERAREIRDQARHTVKESIGLRTTADVLAREAEAAKHEAARVKRSGPLQPSG